MSTCKSPCRDFVGLSLRRYYVQSHRFQEFTCVSDLMCSENSVSLGSDITSSSYKFSSCSSIRFLSLEGKGLLSTAHLVLSIPKTLILRMLSSYLELWVQTLRSLDQHGGLDDWSGLWISLVLMISAEFQVYNKTCLDDWEFLVTHDIWSDGWLGRNQGYVV